MKTGGSISHFENLGFKCELMPWSMLLVWKPNQSSTGDLQGFDCTVYAFNSGGSWETGDVEYYEYIQVTAYFDGVRRIHFSDKDGATSTLESTIPLEHTAHVLNRIVELEKRHCIDINEDSTV